MTVELSWSYGKKWRLFYDVTEVQQFVTDSPYIVIRQDKEKTVLMFSEIKEIIINMLKLLTIVLIAILINVCISD